jgi:subfamily B ATP-binding cassette protein MsbA
VTELARLLRYAAPYRGRFAIALLAMATYAYGTYWLTTLVEPIFDEALPNREAVPRIAVLILAAYLLKGLGGYLSGILMGSVGQRVVTDLRNHLFRHTLNQSASFFARRSTGQLMSRITNDVTQVQMGVSETMADLLRESLTVLFFAWILFSTDWQLAILMLTSGPLVVYPLVRLGQRVRRYTRRGQEELEHLTHLATEGLTGHRIVKAFGAEAREAQRFAAAGHSLYRTNMRVMSALSSLPPLMEFIGGIAAVGALWYGAGRIETGALSTGEFAKFLTAAFLLYGPVKKLSRVNAGLQQTIAAAQRIFGMLDTDSEVRERPGATPLPRHRTRVEFRDVGFAYEDDPSRWALRHVSFSVRAGEVIALVGQSGAGKTTLVNLIPRFYDVTEGAILVDGADIRDVTLASLRQQISLVTQETVLFDDTVAANIAYGVPGAPPEAIEAAARAAHAHEFIVHLAGGYDATIGERGQRLSGGQRQRIAIARALLKDSPILILDEATSALDAESERLVREALSNLMRNRTTFVIAHRLSTVRRADQIIGLDRGHLVEIGTHEELVSRPSGVYARFCALQALDRDVAAPGTALRPAASGGGS